jgi:hypothetical protein
MTKVPPPPKKNNFSKQNFWPRQAPCTYICNAVTHGNNKRAFTWKAHANLEANVLWTEVDIMKLRFRQKSFGTPFFPEICGQNFIQKLHWSDNHENFWDWTPLTSSRAPQLFKFTSDPS